MNEKRNKSVISQSGQVCKGNRRQWAGKEKHDAEWEGRRFQEVIFELRSECRGTSHSEIWDELSGHNHQQVQRAWCNDEGDVLEGCLCSLGNPLISFQNSSHLFLCFHCSKSHHPLHHSKRKSTTSCLPYKHAFLLDCDHLKCPQEGQEQHLPSLQHSLGTQKAHCFIFQDKSLLS